MFIHSFIERIYCGLFLEAGVFLGFWLLGVWLWIWCVCLWCVVCTVLVLYRRLLCSLWLDWMELETLNGMV